MTKGWFTYRTFFSLFVLLLIGFLSFIKTAEAATSAGDAVPGQVLVRVQENLSPAEVQKLAESAGVRLDRQIAPWGLYLFRFDPQIPVEEVLRKLQALPAVQYAEPDVQYQANAAGDSFTQVGSISGATSASPIVVAVIDTGIDFSHSAFAGKIYTNTAEIPGDGIDNDHNGYVDDVHGYDFYNKDADATGSKTNAHGTQTAGRVLQGAGNSPVAILPLLAGISTGLPISAIVEAIVYATNQGARIISMSFGSSSPSTSLEQALNYASDHGVLLIASAGNSGSATPNYPSAYATVISVAASDRNGKKAFFSSYGSSVDFTAPGSNVTTTTWGGGTVKTSGTSFSAPFVAGMAARILASNPRLTPAEVVNQLARLAKDVDALNPSFKGQLGRGLIDEQVAQRVGDWVAAHQNVDRLQASLALAEQDLTTARDQLSALSKDFIRALQDLNQALVRMMQASRAMDSERRSPSHSLQEQNRLLRDYADALDQYRKVSAKYQEAYQRYLVSWAQTRQAQDRRNTLLQQFVAARQYAAGLDPVQSQQQAAAAAISPAGYQQGILQQIRQQQAVRQLLENQFAVDGIALEESADPLFALPESLRGTK